MPHPVQLPSNLGPLPLVILATGCTGAIGLPAADGIHDGPQTPEPSELAVSPSGIDRLTVSELDATVWDLLGGAPPSAEGVLPATGSVFEDGFTLSDPSAALVEGTERVAALWAEHAVTDTGHRTQLTGCTPAGAGDTGCARQFIESFGRRALRRALSDEEVKGYLELHQSYAQHERGDFWTGVQTVLHAFFQSPEFLYHIEAGSPVAGRPELRRLNGWEIASRMAYFLWGSAPPDWLLDLAEADALQNPEQRRQAARRLLDSPRARQQVDAFHALWLGYHKLPHPAELTDRMRQETRALLDRVVFDARQPWLDLFTSSTTYIDPYLASHYGLTSPGGTGFDWVSYADSGRGGLLSHGSYLGVQGKFDDTSPVQRGYRITTRLLCQTIPEPDPDLMVVVDEPPPGDGCKVDRYKMHSSGGCAGCHQHMDPVGFGLESYDNLGRFRHHEPDRPGCEIDGQGELPGYGTFQGPAELGAALASSEAFDQCLVQQLYRFAARHHEVDSERASLRALNDSFRRANHDLQALLTEMVASELFVHRAPPTEEPNL